MCELITRARKLSEVTDEELEHSDARTRWTMFDYLYLRIYAKRGAKAGRKRGTPNGSTLMKFDEQNRQPEWGRDAPPYVREKGASPC